MIVHNVQQGTSEWLALRVGKVTGTNLSKVLGSKWREYAYVVASEIITGKRKEGSFKSFAMDNGTALEPFARAATEECMGYSITEVGFIQPERFPRFGMSPDGLVPRGAVEIKCPEPQTHIRYLIENKLPAEYEDQILSAFVCGDEITFVDFVSFCPTVRTAPFFIKRIQRDEKQIAIARGALVRFFEVVDQIVAAIDQGTGFVPSNIEAALWEITEPEELIFNDVPTFNDSYL